MGLFVTKGAVALVLHAHLPYVRSAQPGSLEEDWFFQALIECYLPLLEMLELASADPNPVSYTHLRAHETRHDLVCRLLLEKKK